MTTKVLRAALGWSLAALLAIGCASAPRRDVAYVRVRPPRDRYEVVGTAPGREFVYVRGHWRWDGRAYEWVPGRWTRLQSGFRTWVAGRWHHSRYGWYWIDGHWS